MKVAISHKSVTREVLGNLFEFYKKSGLDVNSSYAIYKKSANEFFTEYGDDWDFSLTDLKNELNNGALNIAEGKDIVPFENLFNAVLNVKSNYDPRLLKNTNPKRQDILTPDVFNQIGHNELKITPSGKSYALLFD